MKTQPIAKFSLALLCSAGLLFHLGSSASAQAPVISEIGPSPLPVGDAGVDWYTTWETAQAEAKRTNRPIFFMSAAAVCGGVSGVF